MKAQELRDKDVTELQGELKKHIEEGFKLKMQHGSGQLTQHHRIKNNRRMIARIKTILTQKRSVQ